MIDAINGLTVFQFILLVLATLLSVVQLFALAAHVVRGCGATLWYGWIAIVLWTVLFIVTR